MDGADGAPPGVDERLLDFVRFRCREGCALCCFATPAVSPPERAALLRIEPGLTFLPGPSGMGYVAARLDGGACHLLEDLRCRAHVARPFPCREFPITVHLGPRLQASVVMSCPGLDLARLPNWRAPEGPLGGPVGLDPERAAVREELGRAEFARRLRDAQRRWTHAGRRRLGRDWVVEVAQIRGRLRRSLGGIAQEALGVDELPAADEGLEQLPLFFDERHGRVALAGHPGGWELLAIRPEGGVGRRLGVVPVPPEMIRLEPESLRLLEAYLDYWVERDAWVGWALSLDEEPGAAALEGFLKEDLRAIAATTKARAWARLRLGGATPDRLDASALELGIRAVDADFLDRPTIGDVL